jgi:diguanylate cyclase (GGDEF)-like protein
MALREIGRIMARAMNRRHSRSKTLTQFACAFAASAAFFAAVEANCQTPGRFLATLPVLTTTRQAHSLSFQEASRAYPVQLRGVVTFYDPYQGGNPALFIADATGGIFVKSGAHTILPIHAGSVVEVSGVTDPGGYAPIIVGPRISIDADSRPLPTPRRATLPLLLTGAMDGQFVEVEGLVHSVASEGMHVVLTLATTDGLITATTLKQDGANYAGLIDSKVLIPAVAGPLIDNKRQMIGVRLLFPDFKAITVEEPAPDDPFNLPTRPLNRLLEYSPSQTLQHRVHVRGRVTLHWPGQKLCILDRNDGICVRTTDQASVQEGELVDLTGFPERESFHATLSDVQIRRAGDSFAVPAEKISADEPFHGDHTGELVGVDGQLIGTTQVMGNPALLLSSGQTVFTAVLPAAMRNHGNDRRPAWVEGSTVRVTGVFLGIIDAGQVTRQEGVSRLESFQILLRSPADVVVIKTPSWWNGAHALTVLGVLAILTLSILCWVVVLRKRVEEQTLVIRRSEEKFRHLAHHDSLTGLSVRSVLHEALETAVATAKVNRTPFALLMMDVDNFKIVNDTLGHATGDEVLRIVAERIQASLRKTDTVARIGGDEFAALLPGVHSMEEGRRIATHVLAQVSAPIFVRGCEVPVSVSVGVTDYPAGGEDSTSLMQNADTAMYRAKALGRNRYQLFSVNMAKDDELKLDPHPRHVTV